MDQKATNTYNIVDSSGKQNDITLSMDDYRAAAEAGLTLPQYLQRKYPSDMKRGTTFEQCMQASGLIVGTDPKVGFSPPTIKQMFEGTAGINMGTVTRSEGDSRHTPSGRLLFPAIILELVAAQLNDNEDNLLAVYDKMVATTRNVNSERVDQPTIDVTAPEGSRAQTIAQGAEPPIMVNITLAERSYNIPTKSIGLSITDQARNAVTIDQVGLAVSAQARGERIAIVENDLASMIYGNTDRGETALSAVTAQSFDASIVANGNISHVAWIKWLMAYYKKMSITHVIMDVDSYLAVEGRSGKPTIQTDDPKSPRMDALPRLTNQDAFFKGPEVMLLDTAVVGANTIIGIDRKYAIQRTINVGASYEAIEEFVLRRVTSMRFDYGETAKKFFPDAWSMMTLTV